MEELMTRIDRLTDQVTCLKEDLERANAVLRRENERLRSRLTEVTKERDILDKRVRLGTRRIETALGQLALLAEDK